jgi:hypothetical protein
MEVDTRLKVGTSCHVHTFAIRATVLESCSHISFGRDRRLQYKNTNRPAEKKKLGKKKLFDTLQEITNREIQNRFILFDLVMVFTRVSALLLCAVIASLLVMLEGKALEENLEKNAFDKIAEADIRYGECIISRPLTDFTNNILPFLPWPVAATRFVFVEKNVFHTIFFFLITLFILYNQLSICSVLCCLAKSILNYLLNFPFIVTCTL